MNLTLRGAKTRDALVAAAAEIFERDGFADATLDRVCARAGVTKGALYCHFPSKSALAAAVIQRYSPSWREIAGWLAAKGNGPAQTLIDLTFEIVRVTGGDPAHRMSLRLRLHADFFAWAAPAQFPGQIAVVRELLLRARDEGELRSEVDIRRAAEATVAELVGTQLLSHATSGQQDVVGRVEWMWRQRLPGLVVPGLVDRLRVEAPYAWTS